jgi:hypothetical protein
MGDRGLEFGVRSSEIGRSLKAVAAVIALCGLALGAPSQFIIIPVSQHPNTNLMGTNWVFLIAQPGRTNWNISYDQLRRQLGTDATFTGLLPTGLNGNNGTNGKDGTNGATGPQGPAGTNGAAADLNGGTITNLTLINPIWARFVTNSTCTELVVSSDTGVTNARGHYYPFAAGVLTNANMSQVGFIDGWDYISVTNGCDSQPCGNVVYYCRASDFPGGPWMATSLGTTPLPTVSCAANTISITLVQVNPLWAITNVMGTTNYGISVYDQVAYINTNPPVPPQFYHDFALTDTNNGYVQTFSYSFAHGLGKTPQRVRWCLVVAHADQFVGYYPGDILSLPITQGSDYGGHYTTWENTNSVGLYSVTPLWGSDNVSFEGGLLINPINGDTNSFGVNIVKTPWSFTNFLLRVYYDP